MNNEEYNDLIRQLDDKVTKLTERERDLAEHAEELVAQREELTAAIEELVKKNNHMVDVVEQLKERNFELDQILYRMSHDLRAPLLSIKGILSLLALEQQSDTISTYNTHIEQRVGQMDHVLRSLSSLSKSILEKPVYASISLKEIVDRSVISQIHTERGHVTVHCDLHTEIIHSDASLITIILDELLSNAFTFRQPGKSGEILISASTQDNMICIKVADDGDGISPDIQPHIFEIFYRGSERSRGAGLGLYIARKAANLLNGTLTGMSIGNGSEFTLCIPLNL